MKRKRHKKWPHEVDDSTRLSQVHGFGPTLQGRIQDAGYAFRMNMSTGEFKSMIGSYEALEAKLRQQEGDSGYALNMLRTLWKPANTTPESTFMAKRAANNEKDCRGEDLREKHNAEKSNFLLAPENLAGDQAEKRQEKETPEVDALHRIPDPTKAVPLGYIQGGPLLSVVPDVTLNVSPDDKGVNAPSEVLPGVPVPLIPAQALGVNVGGQQGVRMVAPITLEEKQYMEMEHKGPERTKANGEQDMGQDGRGDITEDAKVGQDYPLKNDEQQCMGRSGSRFASKSGKFSMKPYAGGMGGKSAMPPQQQKKDYGMSREAQMNASKHPYKQPSLFANHDMAMMESCPSYECSSDRGLSKNIASGKANAYKLHMASLWSSELQTDDASFYRYNPATQGVQAPYVPPSSSNYLQRGQMTTDFQMLGANPMYNQFGPCPWVFERMTGPFR